MHWFEKQLNVALDADFADSAAFAFHLSEPRFKDRAVEVLRMADFAVSDIRMKDGAGASRHASALAVELLCERHGPTPIWLAPEEYSSGANRLANLLVPLLSENEKDRQICGDRRIRRAFASASGQVTPSDHQ
jgi:hypothetical protein